MKIETEIKLILGNTNIEDLTQKIESIFKLSRTNSFHQITHQFFYEDYTKQQSFPRVRNEQNGRNTLTVKAKIQDENKSEYFKRIELESDISNVDTVIQMMHFFGYPKKVSWEKKRVNFIGNQEQDFSISLDETPMGYFLEIEAVEEKIEEIIKILELENLERTNKAYLGVWADFNKKSGTTREDMLFTDTNE